MRTLVGNELVETSMVSLSLNPARAVGRPVEVRVVEHDDLGVLGDVNICVRATRGRSQQTKVRRANLCQKVSALATGSKLSGSCACLEWRL